MPHVYMANAKEKLTRSVSYTTIFPAPGELTWDRQLAESLERVDISEGENKTLLSALRSLAASPNFQTPEHSGIVKILSKVLPAHSARRYTKPSIDILAFSIRPKSSPRVAKTQPAGLRTGFPLRRGRRGDATGLMHQSLRNINVNMTIRYQESVLQHQVLALLVTKASCVEL
jgi:hypothetical protein